jgi:small GTP-binding protein
MKNQKKATETQDLKIAVLGKSLVGKSALTYRFINDRFPTDHDTTIEDQYRINLNIEGIECMLGKQYVTKEILDTAGQDDYQSMLDSWINFADGFILVYAVNDQESFDNLKSKYERIIRNKQGQKVNIFLVGNKCDLVNERKVSEETARNVSKAWGVGFIEASALVRNLLIRIK